MRDMNPRKSGPGRFPQSESTERHKHPAELHLRDFSGAKLARGAANGTLTMRHPGGVVSQTFRDIQQRKYKESHHGNQH